MKHSTNLTVMAMAAAVLATGGAARAQGGWVEVATGVFRPAATTSPLVQVAAGVWQPAAEAVGPMVQVAPGVWQPSMADPTPQPRYFDARIAGTFNLAEIEEPAAADSAAAKTSAAKAADASTDKSAAVPAVTRATYVANNVSIAFTPTDGSRRIRLVGRVTVNTVSTPTSEDAGTIVGTLKFTCLIGGNAVDVLNGSLTGAYGAKAAPLKVSGTLNIPATRPGEQTAMADVTATLSSDAKLRTTLSGLANVELQ